MKKNLCIVTTLLIAVSHVAIGQLGTHAGAVVSYMNVKSGNLTTEYPRKSGWTFGAMYRASISEKFAIQPEVNFTQKGGQHSPDLFDDVVVLDYLEIPVYFLYQQNKTSGFFGGIAPALNIGMRGTYTRIGGGTQEKMDIKFGNSEDDHLKKQHWAINAQAGYRFRSGIAINGFFTQSITNSSTTDDTNIQLMNFGLRICYFFVDNKEGGNKK
jgi:hypothetical protein